MKPEERKACKECGSSDIAMKIPVSSMSNGGDIGLSYEGFPLPVTEPLLADLCTECGSVQRMYVKYPKRQWLR